MLVAGRSRRRVVTVVGRSRRLRGLAIFGLDRAQYILFAVGRNRTLCRSDHMNCTGASHTGRWGYWISRVEIRGEGQGGEVRGLTVLWGGREISILVIS